MKLIYKPFGIVFGIIAGLLSRRLFGFIWARFDEEEPPHAKTKEAATGKVIGAAVLQGAVFAGTRAAVDRWGARVFYKFTGTWPGPKVQEPVDDE
ncbi:MAG: hypothetical protein QOI80_2119 [Solirubrobacteraceae bacterium]|nr:hypothetical protein [Solirubrobacteraceae bacterium]